MLSIVISACAFQKLTATPTVAPPESTRPIVVLMPSQESIPQPSSTPTSPPIAAPISPVITPMKVGPGEIGSSEQPVIFAAYPGMPFPEQYEWYSNFANPLSKITGLAIQVIRLRSFQKMVEAMGQGQIHFAISLPLHYFVAHQAGYAELAGLLPPTNTTSLLGRLRFVGNPERGLRPSSNLQTVLQQFRDKTPCWITLTPEAGFVVPAGMLARAGVSTNSPVLVKDIPDLARAIHKGHCDFGATYDFEWKPSDYYEFNHLPDADQKVIQLYTSEPLIPPQSLSYAAKLPAAIRDQVITGLFKLTSTKDGLDALNGLVSPPAIFVPPDSSAYHLFGDYVNASDIDLLPLLAPPYGGVPETTFLTPRDRLGGLVIDTDLSNTGLFIPFTEPAQSGLGRPVLPAIYAELVRLDANGQHFPYLVKQLPSLQNGLVRFIGRGVEQQMEVEFQLRPNARWQDGQPLTAQDIVFSWELVMSPNWAGYHFGAVNLAPEIYVDSAHPVTPDRVVFRFMNQRQAREAAQTGGKLGNPTLYADMAQHVGPVVPLDFLDVGRNVFPEHLLKDIPIDQITSSEFARQPIYAGAYRLMKNDPINELTVLESFDDFVLGKPPIPRVIFGVAEGTSSFFESPDVLSQVMQAGEIQAQLALPAVHTRTQGIKPHDYEVLKSQQLGVDWIPRDAWEVLDFNLDNPQLADLRVRQAIAFAINRKVIIEQALDGQGELMRSYLPSWHPYYAGDENLPDYAYDVTRARMLLQESGYDLSITPAHHPSRGSLVLQLASMDVNFYPRPPIAKLIQEQLAVIGVQVDVTFYSWPEFEANDCSGIRNGRKFDLGLAGWIGASGRYPIRFVQNATASTSIPTLENGCPIEKSNWSGWRNAEADAILAQLGDGRLALEQQEEYGELWAKHQRLWANELPSLPLFNVKRPITTVQQLQGVQGSPFAFGNGVEDTWNIYEWILK